MEFMMRSTKTRSILRSFTIIALSLITMLSSGCFEADTTTRTIEASTQSDITTATSSAAKIHNSTESSQIITETSLRKDSTSTTAPTTKATAGSLKVHYLDVGQGDSILIQQGDIAMLIDAGGNANGDQVVKYIKNLGISNLEYVIGTHPHEDHIGGLDDVIKSFDIGKVILPDITHTTKTFEDVLIAIKNKGLKITKAVHGNEYSLGDANIMIVGPITIKASDLNNASVVCRVTFGQTSFLFTGDAETESESAILAKKYNVSANVLKVGHHGSSTSTCKAFLEAVKPAHAIIMVGASNTYGHPTAVTLDKLKAANIKVFRTDLAGTIIATSDGSIITFNVSPSYGTP